MSWLVPSRAGFMPRRVSEFTFKGQRRVWRPKRRWFSELLEDEERKELARDRKIKTEDIAIVDPYRRRTMLEELTR